jgi:hypothetical protein
VKPYGLKKTKLSYVTPPYGTKLVNRTHAKREADAGAAEEAAQAGEGATPPAKPGP